MTENYGLFSGNNRQIWALRRSKAFECEFAGTKLKGMALDWEVMIQSGSIPMKDHIFRALFQPEDENAKEAFNRKYTVTVALQEKANVSEMVKLIRNKVLKK